VCVPKASFPSRTATITTTTNAAAATTTTTTISPLQLLLKAFIVARAIFNRAKPCAAEDGGVEVLTAAYVADSFNGGVLSSTHSSGYISWPSLDSLIFMISTAVSQAISGSPDGFGMKFYGSNAAFSYDGGFHRVAIVFEIENSPSDPTAENTSTPPPQGHRTTARSRSMEASQRDPGPQERGGEQSSGPHHCAVLRRKGLCLWLLVVMWLCALPTGGSTIDESRLRKIL